MEKPCALRLSGGSNDFPEALEGTVISISEPQATQARTGSFLTNYGTILKFSFFN